MKNTNRKQVYDIVGKINKLSYSIIPENNIFENFSIQCLDKLTFVFNRKNDFNLTYNFVDRSFKFNIKVNRDFHGFIPRFYKYNTPYEELELVKQSILEDIDLEGFRIKEAEKYCILIKKYLDEVTDEKVNEILNEIKLLESKIK
jgi:hypothetical protein